MAREIDDDLIALFCLLDQTVQCTGDAPGCGIFIGQNLQVVVVQTAACRGAEEIGERQRVLVGEAQVGDVLFLIIGDADDDGPFG